MRCDVRSLREFYGTPEGGVARRILNLKLAEIWGASAGLDILGLGYASPYLAEFEHARRAIAAMPAQQGVEVWPQTGQVRSALVNETALPFLPASFDRVLLVHALEEAADPLAILTEAARVVTASGRVVIVAAARRGLWASSDATAFGHGQPYSRIQLEALVRQSGLEPSAWSNALYVPPWRPMLPMADSFEQVGSWLWPEFAGVILMEAVKTVFAVRPRGLTSPVLAPIRQLAPASAARRRTIRLVSKLDDAGERR